MNELVKNSIINGDANVTLIINAADLKEVVKDMVTSEREHIAKEVEIAKQKPTIPLAEAMSMLGVSRNTLYLWEKQGYLTPVRIGRKVLYRAADIDEIMTKGEIC